MKTLKEIHDDIEAALFAVQDLPEKSRVKSIIATKLEEALLWTKRALERS